MTAVSSVNVSSQSPVDALSHPAQSRSARSPSLLHLVKAAGVLALALSGGAQAAGLRSFPNDRRLLQSGDQPTVPEPYDYNSICKSGILDSYAEGLNYEDCITQEKASIDSIEKTKPLASLKKCYQVSGYLTAALMGAGLLSSMTCTDAGMIIGGTSGSLGVVALIPTAVCGGMYAHIGGRLKQSREVAEKCCRFFPKKADTKAMQPAPAPQQGLPSPEGIKP
ncbi:MAG: hypothetical protein KKC58_07490 [Gammaproteobacteria bacterium]|nr:hypothetical protein [Gammaproteobacteria bacterium]